MNHNAHFTEKRNAYTVIPGNYAGTIHIPPSKSDSQRVLLIASLVEGTSIIRNIGKSQDELAMIEIIRQLGAIVVQKDATTLFITGTANPQFPKTLNCQESGLSLRMLMSLVAIQAKTVQLTGCGSLMKRDFSCAEKIFRQMGVQIQTHNNHLPIVVSGQLRAGIYEIDGSESSQYISGLLIAFSQINGQTILKVHNCVSVPYIQMTVACLTQFGGKISATIANNQNIEFIIEGKQRLVPIDYSIEGDWSSASYWLVASALGLDISVAGLNMRSLQADRMLYTALEQSGWMSKFNGDALLFYRGDVYWSSPKRLFFDATHCPDLFPILVVLSIFNSHGGTIRGVHRLANKESNRAQSLIEEFPKLGVSIWVDHQNDTLCVESCQHIRSTKVSSNNDHRIAMCLAITSLVSGTSLTIESPEVVAKSYPSFWSDLEALKRK